MHRAIPLLLLLLLPGACFAQGEDLITVYLKDGSLVVGTLIKETEHAIRLKLQDGSEREIQAGDVKDFAFGDRTGEAGGAEEDPGEPGKPGPGIYEEDDIPRSPRSPRTPRRTAEPAAPPRRPAAGEPGDDQPPEERGPALPLVLSEPEFQPQDCPICEGYKVRQCWVCGGDGSIETSSGDVRCNICRGAGKTRCEVCGGSGDSLDPSRAVPCAGCARGISYAYAPGRWGCPSCSGFGEYTIIGQSKSTTCKVCDGDGSFPCVTCGGKGVMLRLFPPRPRSSAEEWQKRCLAGTAAIDSSDLLRGKEVGPANLLFPAREMPALRQMAARLEGMLKRAKMLSKTMVQGSAETARFFQVATGEAMARILQVERDLLEKELGYLHEGEPE